ncbi:MAG: T9SS type A sorting domain-containing protein [Bacteroidales bacterium]|nr:T9SS type A sorting domain-containing protein [Bacteroidales bacterium]
MKNFILFLFLFISSICLTQNYKLLNSTSKKIYSNYPENVDTYSLSFDSVNKIGNDSIYYNFFKIEDWNFVSYDCDFWIGPDCYKQSIPVWIGAKIEINNLYSCNFYPDNGETIHFDFSPIFGDTSSFYADALQEFSLIYEGADSITILSYSDSARFFKIHHTDLDGNVINSQLNGQYIIIAKDLGLIQFFQIDEFPQVLNPIFLIGQENQNLGIFNITNEMLYDFQPGDEFQYEEDYFTWNGPPWWNYTCFRKHTILERIETNDSLIYIIDEIFFYEDSSFIITNTITKAYYKNEIIAQLPFEKFNGDYQQFYLDNYCDLNFWTYYFEAENSLEYCEIDNVWGYFDTNGAPTDDETVRVFGLGMYYDKYIDYMGGIQYSSGHRKEMIYFKKDDVICGDVVVSDNENFINNNHFIVYPNPAIDLIYIKQTKPEYTYNIQLRNLYGQSVIEEKDIQSSFHTMNVSDSKPGLYFYVIKENGIVTQQGKLIKK